MADPIAYRIGAARPGAHVFEVECRVPHPDPAGQCFFMPAWIPGSYLVRDFARHVVHFEAHCDGRDVAVTKVDKSTWRCAPCDAPLTVRYEVYAYDLSVRGAHLDTTHGYFNGPCVFVAVCGFEDEPVTLDIDAPDGAQGWRVATSLAADDAQRWAFGRYRATDYDDLIDHPVEMGDFDVIEFRVAGVDHYIVLCGQHRCNAERLAEDVALVCGESVALFDELPVKDRYLFLTRVLADGYGGLEHRASCSLMCRRDELPGSGHKISKDYRRFLGLVSHEYFHLWNIKRIKPAAFTPYELNAESYTRQLWVFEGVTSYYDDLALARSGVIDCDAYFELVSDTLSRVLSVPGHRRQSLADSSFDAWTKFYKPTPNTPNAVVSYYAKGALVALALDMVIRERSGDTQSLDDVMRAMWATYGREGRGVPEDGFEQVAGHVTGLDLRPFFATAVRGTGDLDFEEHLQSVGLRLVVRAKTPPVVLGFKVRKGTVDVGTVFNDSAAENAGVAPGDQLVALDGLKVTPGNWRNLIHRYRPGERAELHLFRRDELLTLNVRMEAAPERRWKLEIDPDADALRAKRRERWLASNL